MSTNSVLIAMTTKSIEQPANVVPRDYAVEILNASGEVVNFWNGTETAIPPLSVTALPSGTYIVRASRRDMALQPIGEPATSTFTLDKTIQVPDTISVTVV